MPAPILLTGGTGNLGGHVTPLLRTAGNDVRILSRRSHDATDGVEYVVGDLATGAGVAPALDGVETVIHCAGEAKGDEVKAQHLVDAAKLSGRPHVVYISVVGADRVVPSGAMDRAMFGYYASKLGGERAVAGSGLPWTTLRAAQFHDLALVMARSLAKLPVVPVPGVRAQPIEVGEVAARLVELALGEPTGLAPEIAGPKSYTMREVVRSYLDAAGKHRLMVPMRAPGAAGKALRDGASLAPGEPYGRRTWEEFLAANV